MKEELETMILVLAHALTEEKDEERKEHIKQEMERIFKLLT